MRLLELSFCKDWNHPTKFAAEVELRDLGAAEPGLRGGAAIGELRARTKGLDVLFLVHGWASGMESARAAGEQICARMRAHYDVGVICHWPSGRKLSADPRTWGSWYSSWTRADNAGYLLGSLVAEIEAANVDWTAHSLGNRVGLYAARPSGTRRYPAFRNAILMGAAVPDDSICFHGKHFSGVLGCDNLLVAYSRRDGVLRTLYSLSWLGRANALGLYGPACSTPGRVLTVDATDTVPDHGAYRYSSQVMEGWERMLAMEVTR